MQRREWKTLQQEREKLQEDVNNAGDPIDLKATLSKGINRLAHQNNLLEERKAGLRLVYSKGLEKWWTTSVPTHQVPFPIPEDRHTARRYRGAAYACIAFEALLGASIFATFLMLPWWVAILVGTVVAVLAANIFESSILLLFRQVDRPKQMLNDIRRWVLRPGFILFAVSLLFWLAARTATKEMALFLEPAMQITLWLTTVSLLLLGAALLAAASIVSWSEQITGEYRAVEQEQIAANLLYDAFSNRLRSSDPHAASLLLPSRSVMSQNKEERHGPA
jgi:hypothetical protein